MFQTFFCLPVLVLSAINIKSTEIESWLFLTFTYLTPQNDSHLLPVALDDGYVGQRFQIIS